tara:strand:- start:306 stop:1184 length:879 start_codon:yes stop_codon:yes gene_type:complete
MKNLSNNELSEICNKLGESNLINAQKVFGGCIHNSWRLDFKDSKFFLKKNGRGRKLLKFEKYCLIDLEKYIDSDNLIVPKVIQYFELNNNEYLIMEWMNMYKSNQTKLGKGLAKMHFNSHKSNPNKFGYPIEGFIGTSNQIAGWQDDWADFFLKLRIEPQISMLNNKTNNKYQMDDIKLKIKEILSDHNPMCCLIHGDLWSGNVGLGLFDKGIIFDPSCYWADSELDIAMTRLFGGFGREFYDEYHKIIKKKINSEKRSTIYNFYHILNHANMFGGSYFSQVDDYIKKILNM